MPRHRTSMITFFQASLRPLQDSLKLQHTPMPAPILILARHSLLCSSSATGRCWGCSTGSYAASSALLCNSAELPQISGVWSLSGRCALQVWGGMPGHPKSGWSQLQWPVTDRWAGHEDTDREGFSDLVLFGRIIFEVSRLSCMLEKSWVLQLQLILSITNVSWLGPLGDLPYPAQSPSRSGKNCAKAATSVKDSSPLGAPPTQGKILQDGQPWTWDLECLKRHWKGECYS